MDAISRLIFDEAPDDARAVLVIDDEAGELAEAAASRWESVQVWNDRGPVLDRWVEWTDLALSAMDLVLLRLPASLTALDEYAQLINMRCAPEVRIVAAGRTKHMTLSMNTTLGHYFAQIRASLGRDKCRALQANGPLSISEPDAHRPDPWPRSAVDPHSGLMLVAHGATFAGPKLDRGTRLLLSTATAWPDGDAVDFGCGNGVLATTLALRGNPTTAVDNSRFAIASTRATAAANGAAVQAALSDGLTALSDASSDLIVTNPPFHVGTAKDSTPTLIMFDEARRVLRPRGELWCVFNSHLPYLGALRERGFRVSVRAKDRNYTVARAVL